MPGNYNELSGKQLIAIAGILSQELPEDEARLKALKVLLNKSLFGFGLMPSDIKARMLNAVHPDDLAVAEGEEQKKWLDWVFDANRLTHQVLPRYRGYWGPQKEFDNLTLGEFHATEVSYHTITHGDDDEKEAALNDLVAVLYRKPKFWYDTKLDKDGDIRKPYNANVVPYYAKKVASWPTEVKAAILMYYDGCRQHLITSYDAVFSGGDGNEHEAGMFEMIRGLSGNKYGDFDKVEELNIHTALFEIEKTFEEAEKI